MPDGGTFEQIAASLHVKDETVWRRLSEVEGMGLIHRDGRRLLSSGKTLGAIWKLGPSTETIQREQKVMKGKTVADHAVAINKIKKQVISEVKQLF
jgi:DNA-binding Lrp family transcriptional regulator